MRYSCGVPLDNFGSEIDFLLNHSLVPSTARSYNRVIEMSIFFQKGFGSSTRMASPFARHYCFCSIHVHVRLITLDHQSYMSGLSFYCNVNDVEDNTRVIVRKLIDGIKRSRSPQIDNRLPMSKELLGRIIFVLPSICSSNYESAFLKAAFSLAFHGLHRISELIVCPQNISNHTVVHNVEICNDYLDVYLSPSKTDQFGKGTTIHTPAQADHKTCPLNLLKSFLQIRRNLEGPLFYHFDGTPLTRY